MDGTLVDSATSVESSWNQFFAEMGLEITFGHDFHGIPGKAILQKVFPDASEAEIASYFSRVESLEIENAQQVTALEGAVELLDALEEFSQKLNRPCWTIVTSCTRNLFLARYEHLGLPKPLSTMVTADQLPVGKPNPDPYLLGASRIGLDPADCLVLEDSIGGLTAGRLAGAKTLGIATLAEPETLLAHADQVVTSLNNLQLELRGERIQVQIQP